MASREVCEPFIGKGKLMQDFLTPALHGAVCAFAPLQVVALKTEVC